MNLETKTVVVIGAAGLLGREFCSAISSLGARIIIADYNIAAANSLMDSLISSGVCSNKVAAISVNITDINSVTELIQFGEDTFGQITSVVNCAYPRNPNYGRRFEEVEYKDFCENVNLHLGGYFLVSQQFSKYFSNGSGGDIVNIASIYGVIAPKFEVYDETEMTMPVEYSVIKSGLIHLDKYISKYFRGKNVRVNTISPGGILNGQNELFVKRYGENCNSIGMLSPKEIAGVVTFILSDVSVGISGQNIIIDDGFTL